MMMMSSSTYPPTVTLRFSGVCTDVTDETKFRPESAVTGSIANRFHCVYNCREPSARSLRECCLTSRSSRRCSSKLLVPTVFCDYRSFWLQHSLVKNIALTWHWSPLFYDMAHNPVYVYLLIVTKLLIMDSDECLQV